ncbi:MAG: hypothetical protein GXP24_03400 [Planctomycetes bacterium]|nr:hypothetical protein [Planctomycetota bacterium]
MQQNAFLGGVVEGFYGQPWTQTGRLQLFRQMSAWGLNTYFYAPKDDFKHRAIWREPYTETELAAIQELIDACAQHQIRFLYGLSPGLDIQFSNAEELDCIRRRFAQLIEVGAEHFALLFDDLPGNMSEEDHQAFPSLAAAQCSVTNDIHAWVREQKPTCRFLFCPTPYCDRMESWQLAGEGYLETVGELLDPSVDVLWTGPEIVSEEITVDSIQRLTAQRPPVIWDNLVANDYDGRRLYCGPYSGRSVELKQHLAGILLNPNNELPINFVPLRTLAEYICAERNWEPREAYLSAIAEWLPSYKTMSEPISLEELILLADCYYLPHEQGRTSIELFESIKCLVCQPVETWNGADKLFAELNQRVQTTFEKLTELYDRELFYAWSRRAWDLKEELQLIEGFVAKKKAGEETPAVESHLPGTYRGGMIANLQSLLTMDERGRFSARQT